MKRRSSAVLLACACGCGPVSGTSDGESSSQTVPSSGETATTTGADVSASATSASSWSSSSDDGNDDLSSSGDYPAPDLPSCLDDSGGNEGCETCSVRVDWSIRPHGVAEGAEVRLLPVGPRFTVPDSIAARIDDPDYAFLTTNALDSAENGEGEWNTEYAAVANGLLPYSACGAHLGSESWPSGSGGSEKMFLRAYVFAGNSESGSIESRISCLGPALAESVGGSSPTVELTDVDGWRRARLSFVLLFGDYGGTAYLDFFIREYCEATAVLLFMHATFGASLDAESDMLATVESTCLTSETGVECCAP